jgi:hypothetical protein
MHSRDRGPLSTISPLKRYLLLAEGRPTSKRRKISKMGLITKLGKINKKT